VSFCLYLGNQLRTGLCCRAKQFIDLPLVPTSPEGRRCLNQALFEKIFVRDDTVSGADLREPFLDLLDDNLAQRIKTEQALPLADAIGHEIDERTVVSYERALPAADSDLAAMLAGIRWHPRERPCGPLSVDRRNPAAYCRRRGSNKTLLAEGGGFEPPEACTSTVFKTVAFVRSANLPLARLSPFGIGQPPVYALANLGEVAESGRRRAPAKGVEVLKLPVGSNPTLSAQSMPRSPR
jgi:hypothetical protein